MSKPPASNIGLSMLLLSVIAVATVFHLLQGILIPFTLAGFLSILYKPLITKIRSWGIPTWVGLIVVLMISAGAVYGLSLVVAVGVQMAIEKAPEYADKLSHMIVNFENFVDRYAPAISDYFTTEHLNNQITPEQAVSTATSWAGSAVTIVADGAMVLLFLVFMVLGGQAFPKKIAVAFRNVSTIDMMECYKSVNDKVLGYLRVKTGFNLLNGGLTYLVLSLFDVDFALVIAVLAFFFNYIPSIGPMITTILPGIISAIQFESFGQAILIVSILVILQNIVGNFLEPKVMGTSLNISPVVVLFSLVFWGWMWGIVGMILSVPIMAILKTVMEQFPMTQPIAVLLSNSVEEEDLPQKA